MAKLNHLDPSGSIWSLSEKRFFKNNFVDIDWRLQSLIVREYHAAITCNYCIYLYVFKWYGQSCHSFSSAINVDPMSTHTAHILSKCFGKQGNNLVPYRYACRTLCAYSTRLLPANHIQKPPVHAAQVSMRCPMQRNPNKQSKTQIRCIQHDRLQEILQQGQDCMSTRQLKTQLDAK